MAKETKPEEDMVEIGLTEATHEQLFWFAKNQNYECSEQETQNQLFSRIKAAYDHPTITIPRVIEGDASETIRNRTVSNNLPPFVKVKILSIGDDAQTEQYLALEGRAYRIQVGHVVTLPRDVFQSCILDAVELRYRVDGDTGLGEAMPTQAINFTRIE